MNAIEFNKLTRDEQIDLLIQEKVDALVLIDEQQTYQQVVQQKADALAAYEAESLAAIEATRVQRYKGKLALVESFNPKPTEVPIEDVGVVK